MSPLPTLLLILLACLLPGPSSQLECERKEIGRADPGSGILDAVPDPLGFLECTKGPSWTGKLDYTLENPGFQDTISTYKIWWKNSLKRPRCVKTMALFVNGVEDVQEDRNMLIQRDHLKFLINKPNCEQTTFTLKLFIYFKGPLPLDGDKCFEIETGQFYPKMANLQTVFKVNEIPYYASASALNEKVNIFWRWRMFKIDRFYDCLIGITITNEEGDVPNSEMDGYGRKQYIIINGKCKAQTLTLSYTFKGFSNHKVQITIKAFRSMCGKRPSNIDKQEETLIGNYTSTTTGNYVINFLTNDEYKGTIIIVSSFVSVLILISIVTVPLLLKRRRRQSEVKMEERKDHNPIYGTYYDGPTYITVTDNNEMYE